MFKRFYVATIRIQVKRNLFHNGFNMLAKIEFVGIIFIETASVTVKTVYRRFTEAQSLTLPANSAVCHAHCEN